MKKRYQCPLMLIVYGPTASGKTDLSYAIATRLPAEIINMDSGQLYAPLSIGTAKPEWKKSTISHHLFDSVNEPVNYSAADYRTALYKTVNKIIARGNLPILVGGSGFYLHSLLFNYNTAIKNDAQNDEELLSVYKPETDWWQELYRIDPERAMAIEKADIYRIKRALSIWHTTGILPSQCAPTYSPQADFLLIYTERDTQKLAQRINVRVKEMMRQGWIDEARQLIGTPWESFLRIKNLIGYPELFDYLAGDQTEKDYNYMIELISAQTRQYAKRQRTFWRKLEREIKKEKLYTGDCIGCLETVDLDKTPIDVYTSELLKRLPLR